ncbi:hypothetical protein D3C81_607720 [compost metagenome]
MIEPSAAQVAALALPGEDWATGRRRAKRLLNAVCECRPCPLCAPGGELAGGVRGWIDDGGAACRYCAGYIDSVEEWHAEHDGDPADCA